VAEFALNRRGTADSEAVLQLLRTVIGDCPHQSRLFAELGKQFFARGELDSARHYLGRGEALGDLEPLMLQDALASAAMRGNFSGAADIALRRYEITDEITDLEQAAICAAAHDTARALRLYQQVTASPAYTDSTSIAHWFFDHAAPDSARTENRHFFSGKLFYLNFPASVARYRRNGDKRAYYLHKAGAFYAAGVYDSAAYYNLNLLRILDKGDPLGYRTIFNLAAEYYAAGEYALSYTRFLDLYRHFGGASDPAVHFALALNYERCGDISRARSHFYYVIHTSRDSHSPSNLVAKARSRLRRLGGARPVVLR
jgi:tetratricopeptide (TPR) repeat protein